MRLVVAPLILGQLKRKYLKKMTSTIKDGWIEQKDLDAIEYIKVEAWKGVSTPFVISYDYILLANQVKRLLIAVAQIYNEKLDGEIDLKISVQKTVESFYLMFQELNSDLSKIKLFRLLKKLPVSLFLRVSKINQSISVVTQNRIIKTLQKYRLTAKIIRVILIPILGIPILIYQLLLSLLYATLFEGYVRFIYGLILIKVGYYAIYLYSDRNSSLHSKIEFSKKGIINGGIDIEKKYTQFSDRFRYTQKLEEALKTLKNELGRENILHSREVNNDLSSIERFFKRAVTTIKNSIENELTSGNKSNISIKKLIDISIKIGRVYFTKSDHPILDLRVKEFLELGYLLTTLSLKTIYTVPGSKLFMDKIPLKLIFDINDFIDEKDLKKHFPTLKKGGRVLKNIQSYYWATKFIVKRSSPILLVSSIAAPLITQQINESVKEYIFNTSLLLLIDSYESTILKDKTDKINN